MRRTLQLSLIALSLTLLLAGCSLLHPYRPPLQQGNVLEQETVGQVRLGMTRQDVVQLLGQPVLNDTFQPNRWAYVYTYRPSRGPAQQKKLVVYFRGNYVARIEPGS